MINLANARRYLEIKQECSDLWQKMQPLRDRMNELEAELEAVKKDMYTPTTQLFNVPWTDGTVRLLKVDAYSITEMHPTELS
jgi:hypothetical protein